jgi:hypothetical protein
MKKLILASLSALALLGVAACSDSGTDTTQTQSVNPPAQEQPAPSTGTDGDAIKPVEPAPTNPAPAQ